MADFREISQDYAQGAIKAVILLNGGAAVALLSQVGALAVGHLLGSIRAPMILWALGAALGGAAWLFGFHSSRYVDKSEREAGKELLHLATSNTYMGLGVVSVSLSLLCFLVGCVVLACTLGG